MDEQARARAIRDLYARIPAIACKRKCQDYCVAVVDDGALSRWERDRIVTFHGAKPPRPNHRCGYLDEVGRCSVYAMRPFICRMWGVLDAPGMRCEFGCKPERYLSAEEGRALADEVYALGGGVAPRSGHGVSEQEREAGMLHLAILYAAEHPETWDLSRDEDGIRMRRRP